MKNYKLLTIALFFISITSFAQDGLVKERFKEKKEQIKALKVAFITSELDLTPDEAAKFWPLFNAFEDKQQEIRKQKMKAFMDRSDNGVDKLTEKEATALLTQMENTEEELYQLKKKFVSSLKGVLPAKKILKLKKAEEEFSKKLLQQYRDKKIGR
ncbi:sensor of ECF-type sigma factor [Flavobacterium sp. SUN052]|uniref:sensor of ECF-type sigma factor n=1 Tax=Flavobacterium sp. SUN052 TaxID=3002441 RepID=UPI00237ECD0E|nr:sensor of ECF-type sigma factor [Flavobacterium sp. SUN052]MEC4005657.1 sensor of ECF-type sigma factor [Flavobacterium sp. SUN052]